MNTKSTRRAGQLRKIQHTEDKSFTQRNTYPRLYRGYVVKPRIF